jgi:hypothetical protein
MGRRPRVRKQKNSIMFQHEFETYGYVESGMKKTGKTFMSGWKFICEEERTRERHVKSTVNGQHERK